MPVITSLTWTVIAEYYYAYVTYDHVMDSSSWADNITTHPLASLSLINRAAHLGVINAENAWNDYRHTLIQRMSQRKQLTWYQEWKLPEQANMMCPYYACMRIMISAPWDYLNPNTTFHPHYRCRFIRLTSKLVKYTNPDELVVLVELNNQKLIPVFKKHLQQIPCSFELIGELHRIPFGPLNLSRCDVYLKYKDSWKLAQKLLQHGKEHHDEYIGRYRKLTKNLTKTGHRPPPPSVLKRMRTSTCTNIQGRPYKRQRIC